MDLDQDVTTWTFYMDLDFERPSVTEQKHETEANAGLMSAHRLRLWPNIKTASAKRLMLAGTVLVAGSGFPRRGSLSKRY